jgi:hypothetical protein
MSESTHPTRDDRVLRSTRALAVFIAPFLLVAFVILFGFPGDTRRLWAWPIRPTMTAMVLAAAYLGGCLFFVRVLRERHWAAMKFGFVAVAIFASVLGVVTIVHWDRFTHGHVAFWLWAGLYFTAPFLVVAAWLVNRRYAATQAPGEARLGTVSRAVVAVTGLAALGTGLELLFDPTRVIPVWPWALTPLTSRVMGAVFCLGCAGLGALVDPRWVALRLMLQVEGLMVALILVAAGRARGELFGDRPLTWLMLGGFGAVLIGSGYLWVVHERRPGSPEAR